MKIMKVMKFGGSSVGSAERIKNVAKIVLDARKKGGVAVVVSAMQGVTDKLLALDFNFVKEKHLATAKELKVAAPTELLAELEGVIKGINLLGDASPMALDLVVSFGERLSANLVAAYLNRHNAKLAKRYANHANRSHHLHYLHSSHCAVVVDSRELVKTDSNFQNAAVDFVATNRNIKSFFLKLLNPKTYSLKPIPVITGFISSNTAGKTTTLGRGGSDYSGAIFGAALGANVIEIWTDADGVMTADPRIVKTAFTLPQISYEEAFEMAYFGAKVIHPATMLPAIKKNIPVLIKNTFNPRHPGTVIGQNANDAKQYANIAKDSGYSRSHDSRQLSFSHYVKNISAIDGVSLITVGGTELAGVPGTAERVFRAAAEAKANVVLIAQASSEHTICLAIKKSEADRAMAAIRAEFEPEIRKGKVAVERKEGQSIIAVVGDNMRGVPGIAGRIFDSLGRAKINISAIAQGGSERNVSLVVDESNKIPAIQILHREFFDQSHEPAIFLLGTGNVGGQLLRQLQSHPFRVCGLADIAKMHFTNSGIDLKNWKKILQKSDDKMVLPKFLENVRNSTANTKILVDCTASEAVAKLYPEFVKAGCDIVTPNKKANVLPLAKYQALRRVLHEHRKAFHYQANVGAGLPVIETVKRLVASGDEIKKIEGIFSGTLSYLFNSFDPVKRSGNRHGASGKKFSELVQMAKAFGYTEPDPKEDLSGQDVGRKLLILAREMNWPVEPADIRLENLASYNDKQMADRWRKARSKRCVLRYVGTIANKRAAAKLKEIDLSDPLAQVSGTDNVVAIYSKYYKNQPLVIKGPGAGAEVTASAILAGIIKTVKNLWKPKV